MSPKAAKAQTKEQKTENSASEGKNPENGTQTATAQAPNDQGQSNGVHEHDLSPLTEHATSGAAGNIDLLMDVSVPVVAQLGSTEMRIKEILQLLPGSIVELEKLAGEPADLLVRGQLFAQGEVVVVDESFGIRITKILTPDNREESDDKS